MENKKKLIIDAISTMDIPLLEELLDDKITYCGLSKQVFISKLGILFHQFKYEKATKLKKIKGIYKGSKKSGTKQPLNALAFVDTKSNSYLILVFEESKDDFSNIFESEPDFFKPLDRQHDLSYWGYFDLNICEDEKVGFVPHSEEFAELLKKCEEGYNEIFDDATEVINQEFADEWFEKYDSVRRAIPFEEEEDFYRSTRRFRAVHDSMDIFYSELHYSDDAESAIKELEPLNTAIDVFRWYFRNRHLIYRLFPFMISEVAKGARDGWMAKYGEFDRSFYHKVDLTEFETLLEFSKCVKTIKAGFDHILSTFGCSTDYFPDPVSIKEKYKQLYRVFPKDMW